MRHTTKLLALTTTLALAATAGSATAQMHAAARRTPPQVQAPRLEQNRPVAINGHFRFPMERNCAYSADIRGTARPAGANPSGEQLYTASGVVTAMVSCPGRSAIRGSENLSTAQPSTLPEIERAIETRGSLTTDTGGQHCAYVPNFTLTARRLQGVGAALMCPAPTQDSLRGGGPTNK